MSITFQFRLDKSVQALAYLLKRLGGRLTKIRILKLLFFADLRHFLKHGRPITGDSYYAMKYGPVPSCTYDAIGGDMPEDDSRRLIDAFLQIDGYDVALKRDPELDLLSESEMEGLDEVVNKYGDWDQSRLVEETHRMPEYRKVYPDPTISTYSRLDYDLFLENRASPEIRALVEEEQKTARALR